MERTVDAIRSCAADPANESLTLEGSEDNEAEFDCEIHVSLCPKKSKYFRRVLTINIYQTSAMTYQPLGRPEQVVHADAEANLLDDSVGVLGVDVVLYGYPAVALELCRCNLHQICDLCL